MSIYVVDHLDNGVRNKLTYYMEMIQLLRTYRLGTCKVPERTLCINKMKKIKNKKPQIITNCLITLF